MLGTTNPNPTPNPQPPTPNPQPPTSTPTRSMLGSNFTYLPPTRLRGLLPDVSPNTGGMVLELLL